MSSASRLVWGSALGVAALVACAADDRGLSFEVGAVSSAGSSSGNDAASGSGSSGTPSSEGGQDAAAGGDSGPDSAGQPAAGNPSAQAGSSSAGAGTPNGGSAGANAGAAGTGDAGSGGGGAPSAGGGGSSGTGGVAGTGGDPFASPCGDLNVNLVDDCEETLVKNSRFDTALADWTPDGPLLTQHWDATDARSQPASGSLSVLNSNVVVGGTGNTTLGSGQCLVAWGNQRFEVGARAFIKSGQAGGRASVNLLVFGHDGCQGVLLDGLTVDSVSTPGSWRVISGSVKMPAAARSVLVRLVATKPFAQTSLEVLFDDVLMREQ